MVAVNSMSRKKNEIGGGKGDEGVWRRRGKVWRMVQKDGKVERVMRCAVYERKLNIVYV